MLLGRGNVALERQCCSGEVELLWGGGFTLGRWSCSGEVELLWGGELLWGVKLLGGGNVARGSARVKVKSLALFLREVFEMLLF